MLTARRGSPITIPNIFRIDINSRPRSSRTWASLAFWQSRPRNNAWHDNDGPGCWALLNGTCTMPDNFNESSQDQPARLRSATSIVSLAATFTIVATVTGLFAYAGGWL